jgi:hypothetical protein
LDNGIDYTFVSGVREEVDRSKLPRLSGTWRFGDVSITATIDDIQPLVRVSVKEAEPALHSHAKFMPHS